VAIILNRAPTGQPQLAPIVGEYTSGFYSDEYRTEVAGAPVRQFTLVQSVSDLTQGPEPAFPPVGIDRLWADTQGLIHHLHSNGVDTILTDPLQVGVVTSGMILDGTIAAADMAAGAAAGNVGALGGVLTGTLPSPSMAAGAAAGNVGALSGALSGFLPNPALASGVAISNPNITNPIITGSVTGSPSFGTWTSWAPACSQGGSTPGVTVNYATYMQLGKMVHVSVYLTFSSSGSAGADIIISTTPVAPRMTAAWMTLGSFTYLRSGVTTYVGSVLATSAALLRFNSSASAGGALLGTSPSFAVGINDVVSFTLMYEAA
jgi:hypothetical protein